MLDERSESLTLASPAVLSFRARSTQRANFGARNVPMTSCAGCQTECADGFVGVWMEIYVASNPFLGVERETVVPKFSCVGCDS